MKWNKEQESILNDTIKMVEKWCIESRVKELGLVTKKLMENKEPIDVLDLLKWIGNRKEKLEAGILSIPLEAGVDVKIAEEQIMRKIGGALKSTMDRHGGVITKRLINSAVKRIYGELYKNQDSNFSD